MQSLESYMLASDTDATAAQRKLVSHALYNVEGAMGDFAAYTEYITLKLLKKGSDELGRNSVYQVDIVKE